MCNLSCRVWRQRGRSSGRGRLRAAHLSQQASQTQLDHNWVLTLGLNPCESLVITTFISIYLHVVILQTCWLLQTFLSSLPRSLPVFTPTLRSCSPFLFLAQPIPFLKSALSTFTPCASAYTCVLFFTYERKCGICLSAFTSFHTMISSATHFLASDIILFFVPE